MDSRLLRWRSFSKASVNLADVDGGIDIAMPMFSRTEVRLSVSEV
jgi:hypothetical protein